MKLVGLVISAAIALVLMAADSGSGEPLKLDTGELSLRSGTVAAAARCKHRRHRCHRHRGTDKPPGTIDETNNSKVATTSPPGGNDPDLRDPWRVGISLVAGGDCGYHPKQGDHQDWGNRWQDDRFAWDFGVCGAADNGLPVLAATSGVVRVAEHSPYYGWTVVIEKHKGGLATRYAQLQSGLRVHKGDRVKAGQRIGRIGASEGGQTPDDAHLHFVLYRNPQTGRRIVRIGRQRLQNDRIYASQRFRPGKPLKEANPYGCHTQTDARYVTYGHVFNTGDFSAPQPFYATGRQIVGGDAFLRAQAPSERVDVIISDSMSVDTGSVRGVSRTEAIVPPDAATETHSYFRFEPPVLTHPHELLWLTFEAFGDGIFYYEESNNDPAHPISCVVASLEGTD